MRSGVVAGLPEVVSMRGLVEGDELVAGFFEDFVDGEGFQSFKANRDIADPAANLERHLGGHLGFQEVRGFDIVEGSGSCWSSPRFRDSVTARKYSEFNQVRNNADGAFIELSENSRCSNGSPTPSQAEECSKF